VTWNEVAIGSEANLAEASTPFPEAAIRSPAPLAGPDELQQFKKMQH
jgi:hypothetical protein